MADYRCPFGVLNCPDCFRFGSMLPEMLAGYVYKTQETGLKVTQKDGRAYEVNADNTLGRLLDHDKIKNIDRLDAVGLLAKAKTKLQKLKEYAS